MITSKKTNIDKICNFVINDNHPYQPVMTINYIDFVTENEDIYYRELKRKNRELAIDIILGEKSETNWDDRDSISFDSNYHSNLSAKILTVNTRALPFTSDENLEYDIFKKLDILTQSQPKLNNLNIKFNIMNNIDSVDTFRRKIISKIMTCDNLIQMDSRKGPANTIIFGRNLIEYVIGMKHINGMDLILSNHIDPNKVIVMRTEDQIGIGLNVILKKDEMKYFIVETPISCEKVIKWFWIN